MNTASTKDQATTVQPATDDQIIETDCKIIAYYLREGRQDIADEVRERMERMVLKKYDKRADHGR